MTDNGNDPLPYIATNQKGLYMFSFRRKQPENLTFVREALRCSRRMGADKDEPEGSRYIQISDTLARKMVKALKKNC